MDNTLSLTSTIATRRSRVRGEILMPCLDEMFAFFLHFGCDDAQSMRGKADLAHDLHIWQPELYRISVLVDMGRGRSASLLKT